MEARRDPDQPSQQENRAQRVRFGPASRALDTLRRLGGWNPKGYATKGRAGGKLPGGNFAVKSPDRSFSEASLKAATNQA